MSSVRLLIFARAPIPGRCKSRLARRLGDSAAARVQRQLIARALRLAAVQSDVTVELWGEPGPGHAVFWRARLQYRVRLRRQWGGTLGERMYRALTACTTSPGIVIGTDCPALSTRSLAAAREALAACPLVLIPATDGGYVLVAARRPEARLFQRIRWGGPHVMAATRQHATRLGLHRRELEVLDDLDYFYNWQHARRAGQIPPLYCRP